MGSGDVSWAAHNADDNNRSSKQSSNNNKNEDLISLPIDTHSSQMLQLAAENAAIDDCIYVLDQSMGRGNMPLEVFLKEVRRLSKRQFMVKAHLMKISEAKIRGGLDKEVR